MKNFKLIIALVFLLNIKKSPRFNREDFTCARSEIRTRTPLRALPPQSSASTNFAIRALKERKYSFEMQCAKGSV